ncbi:MAG: 3-methyl-2-oxobutanoate dehydrogenase subunit VorB [Firmicutes bacterium]|nr:3-methyl-2-oxobutanoate dehydrogenase subunit VorB [Bacillota bacterium]
MGLMKGNEAIAEAAIRAGCRAYFGYPITPQNEIPEYMAKHLPKVGGVFLQAESELAAINMVYGAGGAGVHVMTSSSSPGISLKQEGLSYIACAEVPCVVVNMMRSGPGLGGILPAQGDYFQATKGGGHGDYHLLVLAPSTIQEAVDLTYEAFDLARRYRNPVMILGDGLLGQMMESVTLPQPKAPLPKPPWATTGCGDGEPRVINSLYIQGDVMEERTKRIFAKYAKMKQNEIRFENYKTDGAKIILAAYGSTARIAKTAVDKARTRGIKVGLFRPISLYPFPYDELSEVATEAKAVLTVEMSMGQMVEDVRLAVEGRCPVRFYGRSGGIVPTPQEILQQIQAIWSHIA